MPRGVPKDGKKRKHKKRSPKAGGAVKAPAKAKDGGQALADAIQEHVKAAIDQEIGRTVNLLKLATKKNTRDIVAIKQII